MFCYKDFHKLIAQFLIFLYGANFFAVTNATANFEDGTNISTYWCEDAILKDMQHQLQLLNVASEGMRLKLDMYNLRLNQEIKAENSDLLQKIKQLLTQTTESEKVLVTEKQDCENLIDVRSDFGQPDNRFEHRATTTNTTEALPKSCAEALYGGKQSGIYLLHLPKSKLEPFYVYCLTDPNNGTAWTVVQRREESPVDFFRDWLDYKTGFGNIAGAYFIGLDKLYALTQSQLHELWIDMEDFDNVKRFAKYETFAIGDESTKYALNVLGKYSGDAGDSFSAHQGQKFTTKDADNDVWEKNCAAEFTGAWWYTACHSSNLNGQYLRGEYAHDKYAKGVVWHTWHGHYYSLKNVIMAIRPKHGNSRNNVQEIAL